MFLVPLAKNLAKFEILFTIQNDGIPDRFIMAGENYKIIREVITRVVLGEEAQIIDEALQVGERDRGMSVSFLEVSLFNISLILFTRWQACIKATYLGDGHRILARILLII